MTTTSFSDIYAGGAAAVSVPAGVYDVRVSDARAGKAESRTIFIDLEVLNGPAAGKVAQVNLFVPQPHERGQVFYYQKKTAGFRSPEFKAALDQLGPEPAIDDLLEGIANFLIGKTVSANIEIQSGGQYDGQNQLESTKPLGTPITEAVPQAETPAPAPVAADNGAGTFTNAAEDEPF